MIPHNDGHYHDHDLYHHMHNDDDDANDRIDVVSDDDKENSGDNDNRYDNRIPGHYHNPSKDGSNAPAVVVDHS